MTDETEERATLFVTWTRDGRTVRERFGAGPGPRSAISSMLADMVRELWKRDDVSRIEIDRGDRRASS